jgi:hypothetical protein
LKDYRSPAEIIDILPTLYRDRVLGVFTFRNIVWFILNTV